MSTQNINISRENVKGKCDLKCSYNFKYSESNSTAKNNGVMLSLTYDNSSVSPVMYNNEKYTVSKIVITSPSIHLFNGSTTDAEIFIEHTPVKGGPNLMVGIPIKSSTESSTASNLITEVIQSVGTNAPAQGDSTNLNLSGFTLENIIPQKPFYSYTESETTDWIVFDILEAIPLNKTTLSTLSQIIKPFPIPTPGTSLFLNSAGPNSGGNIGDGIYISCKPVGSSEEETAVEYTKNTPSYDLSSMMENPVTKTIFQIIIGCIIFIIVFSFISYAYTLITGSSFSTFKKGGAKIFGKE
jgi:carbonic anhydrase